jgi:predicted DCC family thiol-disulfide oxidoreductase YuxK
MRPLRKLTAFAPVAVVLQPAEKVFLFDGRCATCNIWVKFLAAATGGELLFTSAESEMGVALRRRAPDARFVLLSAERIDTDSDAILGALGMARRWPRWMRHLTLIPKGLRDWLLTPVAAVARVLGEGYRTRPCQKPDPALAIRMVWNHRTYG